MVTESLWNIKQNGELNNANEDLTTIMISSKKTNKLDLKSNLTYLISFLILMSFSLTAEKLNTDSLKENLPGNFNGQIAIEKNTQFIFNVNFGYKEQTYGTEINDSTLFNVGEISHTFIHYFIKHLVKLRQINVSEPVNKYLVDFPYDSIQIKHLINHQSGLPKDYIRLYHKKVFNNMDIKAKDKEKLFDNDDILFLLSRVKPQLLFKPGDSIAYSNIDYLLLVSLIEKVTFTPFPDFVAKIFKHHNFVFTPLVSILDTIPNKAMGYRLFEDETTGLFENLSSYGFNYDDGTTGNQHLYLSAKNLALWAQFIFNDIDFGYIKANPSKYFMGGIKYNKQLEVTEKEGGFGGTYTKIIFIPENGIIAVVISNIYTGEKLDKLVSYLKLIDE